jgi:hypothetical protein
MRVHLAAEHALELEMPHGSFQMLSLALDVGRCRRVTLAGGELEQLGRLADTGGGAVDFLDVSAQARAFAPELLGARGIRPDGRILQLARNLFEPLALAIVLKETPVAQPCAR